jgi:hypothetical protein
VKILQKSIACDVGHRWYRCWRAKSCGAGFPNQEGVMSLAYRTDQKADLKHRDYGLIRDYGFILTLVCLALALVVVSVIFTPASVDNRIANELTYVGP